MAPVQGVQLQVHLHVRDKAIMLVTHVFCNA